MSESLTEYRTLGERAYEVIETWDITCELPLDLTFLAREELEGDYYQNYVPKYKPALLKTVNLEDDWIACMIHPDGDGFRHPILFREKEKAVAFIEDEYIDSVKERLRKREIKRIKDRIREHREEATT